MFIIKWGGAYFYIYAWLFVLFVSLVCTYQVALRFVSFSPFNLVSYPGDDIRLP